MKLILCLTTLVAAVMAESELGKVLKAGNDQFTAKMFQEVVKIEKGKSSVLSAFSVLTPLAQLALASVGESHDELLRVIGFPNDDTTKEVFTEVNNRLKNVKGVELKQANKLYIAENVALNDNFAAVSKSVFDSEFKNIKFSDSVAAANEINAWVEDHTNKRIKNLVDENSITPNTVAVLVNAIYFKGKWQNKFDKDRTEDRDFHVTKDKTVTVKMMNKLADFKYGESQELDAQLVELPYEGNDTSLVVILPKKVDGIDDLIQKLSDYAALNKALDNMYEQEVDVSLPRFKIETTTNLKKVLENMNIKKLFTPGEAQLSNLLKSGDLYVSDAVQKAFIEVNEEGAEAAAANSFIMLESLSIPSTFNADHPFVFFLMEKRNTLFNGVFQN
ncbi:unnamed protein product [Arctia plantaginis]|uniref:Serpin domain-containing protein n=1 Tax=Arctia plantaginis TaxID=874455 RepID=A0A8S1AF07_ARCPL|nr:unnamed protein product [Arctia plantaginis]CAB3252059.1 unnamed protein product [Arctia plantaginis]